MAELDLQFLFVLGLASFRLTRVIVFDEIAEFIRAPFMDEVEEDGEVYIVPKPSGVKNWFGRLLSCYWCTGVWVSGGLLAAYYVMPKVAIPLIFIFAIAAIGSIIETVIKKLMGD